jgi:hypothetical protein
MSIGLDVKYTMFVVYISGEPCKGGVSIPGSYCGMGGQPCPVDSYCDIHPADAYAVCCISENEREYCDQTSFYDM